MIEINEPEVSAPMLGVANRGDKPSCAEPWRRRGMQLWLIPSFYAAASIVAGLLVPRLKAGFMASGLDLSTSSAQTYLSAVASGMMALTGIVFSIAFVLVQFNAVVYSPSFCLRRDGGEGRP
ncbi:MULTISPECIES: DUF2254 family protein [unclassified Bradyrhizobium]|uniref:DUF2254 family protein n=1 Tax=unclassified Bradyrhizobium TaxID=2631580 RepID=UPI00104BF476|nr:MULTISPECIES: DUF2254 family protein [unclassified Bradyrhizobium]